MIRERLKAAQVTAMKAGDKQRTATIRLIQSALKNRDIELRGKKAEAEGRAESQDFEGNTLPPAAFKAPAGDDALVVEVLQKMIKQRRESIALYEQGGRAELADAEKAELAVIEDFLPQQMSEDETSAAIDGIVTELGASSVKDMGRVMATLKDRHGSQLDMSKASALVKARLSA